LPQRSGFGGGRVLVDGARPGPVAGRADLLGRPSPDHPAIGQAGATNELLGGPGLSDPGFAEQHEKTGASRARLAEPCVQELQLALATDESGLPGVVLLDHPPGSRTSKPGMTATGAWAGQAG